MQILFQFATMILPGNFGEDIVWRRRTIEYRLQWVELF